MQGSSDDEIFDRARDEQRSVVSADTDFGTVLTVSREQLPSVVLCRRGTQRRRGAQTTLLLNNLPTIEAALVEGSIVVIEHTRIRIRRLPVLP